MIVEQYQSEWVSLYDYLKRTGRTKVGVEVYRTFKKEYEDQEPKVRQVSNRGYKGPVRLYPKKWLDKYFQQHGRL